MNTDTNRAEEEAKARWPPPDLPQRDRVTEEGDGGCLAARRVRRGVCFLSEFVLWGKASLGEASLEARVYKNLPALMSVDIR